VHMCTVLAAAKGKQMCACAHGPVLAAARGQQTCAYLAVGCISWRRTCRLGKGLPYLGAEVTCVLTSITACLPTKVLAHWNVAYTSLTYNAIDNQHEQTIQS